MPTAERSISAVVNAAGPTPSARAVAFRPGDVRPSRQNFTGRKKVHVPSLLWALVRTDFKLRYHGTIGGFLWALLRPLMMFLVLQGVFSLIFATDPKYRFNLLIGLFIWDFFVEASKGGLSSLVNKAHLLTKTRLPTWLLVVASSSNAIITLAIFFVIIIVALAVVGATPAAMHVLLFAGYLSAFWCIILGFSLATSVLFARYRDLNQVWDLILQVGFFAAPIVYPLNILPLEIHFYLYLWPPTPVIQFARSVLVDGEIPTLFAHGLLAVEAILTLCLGALIFRRYAPRVPEHL
jgi:lipopolysaccharide transport system permease protein